MKREDLEKLGLTAEAIEKAGLPADVIDRIMTLHGKDIESHKTKLAEATSTADNLKGQLADANKQIENFKSLPDVTAVMKSADEWKAKAEQATKDADAKVARLKFDHALQGELGKAKVKNAKTVIPMLDMDALLKGFDEKEGTFANLDKQLANLKESDAYLFSDDDTVTLVKGGGNQPVLQQDALLQAAMRGAQIQSDGK